MQDNIHFIKKFIKTNDSIDYYLSETQEFNNNGSLILNEIFNEEKILLRKFYAEYNEAQKLILERNEEIEDEFEETKTYFYDEKARLQTEIIKSNSGWLTKKVYEHNDDEKTVKITSYDEDDIVEESFFIQYSDNNKIIYKKDFDETGKLVNKISYEYDNQGNMINSSEFDNKEKLVKEYDYTYNINNQVLELVVYNYKGKIIDWAKYEYNDKNQLVKQSFMSGECKTIDYEDLKVIEKYFDSNSVEKQSTETILDKNGKILEEHTQVNQVNNFSSLSLKFEYIYY